MASSDDDCVWVGLPRVGNLVVVFFLFFFFLLVDVDGFDEEEFGAKMHQQLKKKS